MTINPFNPGEVTTSGLTLSGLLAAVGETVALDSGTDWATLTQPGIYSVSAIAAGFPISAGKAAAVPGMLNVIESNGSVLQTYHSSDNEIFSRIYMPWGWSPWSTVSVPYAPSLGFSNSAVLATSGVLSNFTGYASLGLGGFDSINGTFAAPTTGTYYIELTLTPVSAPAIGAISISGARQSFNLITNDSLTFSVIRPLDPRGSFTTFDVTLTNGSVRGYQGRIIKLI